MPIGNLTSQIFANIYLNEFDRFVRQTLKPQGYVRYGDDFIVILPTYHQAIVSRTLAIDFLAGNLKLEINPKNDFIFPAGGDLKFLGHRMSQNKIEVEGQLAAKVLKQLNVKNISSYKALYLPPDVRDQIDYVFLTKYLT